MNPMINGLGGRVPREESCFQDRDVLTQPAVLGLEALDLSMFFAGLALPVTGVDLGLDHPPAQRLDPDTSLATAATAC